MGSFKEQAKPCWIRSATLRLKEYFFGWGDTEFSGIRCNRLAASALQAAHSTGSIIAKIDWEAKMIILRDLEVPHDDWLAFFITFSAGFFETLQGPNELPMRNWNQMLSAFLGRNETEFDWK